MLRRFFAGARGGLDLGYLRKFVEVVLLAPLSLVPVWNEEIRMDEFVKATAPLLAANLLTVALIHSFLKYVGSVRADSTQREPGLPISWCLFYV
jgi:hypothetical protein